MLGFYQWKCINGLSSKYRGNFILFSYAKKYKIYLLTQNWGE